MKIEHDEKRRRFVAQIEGGEAVLDYDRVADDTLDYKHTFVPPENRGRGIAGRLVRHALDYARDNDLKVIPTCPFVAAVIGDYPEYEALIESS
ncbi:MAG: N-acetyltransferase [Gammaproteobacteria bacterium]|nr:N-acetyltransferase [Gammaproteobacteria bacterium]